MTELKKMVDQVILPLSELHSKVSFNRLRIFKVSLKFWLSMPAVMFQSDNLYIAMLIYLTAQAE